jgi:hypothetical protein
MTYVGDELRRWRSSLDPQRWSKVGGTGLGCYFTETEINEIIKEHLRRLLDPMVGDLGSGEVFVDKTPSHALYLKEIAELLPEARVIHALRDARDVVASMLHASRGWGRVWAPRSAASAVRMWESHVKAAVQGKQWIPAGQYFEIRYEHLSRATREVLWDASGFLGLKWDPEVLMKAIEENTIDRIKSGGGTRIPIGGEVGRMLRRSILVEPEGFVRKGSAGSWKSDLSAREKLIVWFLGRRTMESVGYPW